MGSNSSANYQLDDVTDFEQTLVHAANRGDSAPFAHALAKGAISPATPFSTVRKIIDLFSDATLRNTTLDMSLLNGWIRASTPDGSPEDQPLMAAKSKHLATLLDDACGLYPHRSTAAIHTLLTLGADPSCCVGTDLGALGGMRHDMYRFNHCPLSTAIENGYRAIVDQMVDQLYSRRRHNWMSVEIATVGIAPVNVDPEQVNWIALDPLAFACVTGQTEMVRNMLDRTDFSVAEACDEVGKSVARIAALGILSTGPDSVLSDVAAMLAAGAQVDPRVLRRLANLDVTVSDLSIRNSAISPQSAKLPGLLALCATTADNMRSIDAAGALDVLLPHVATPKADMLSPSKGEKLAHCCALGGSVDVLRACVSNGHLGTDADAEGTTAISYAQSSGNQIIAKLFQNIQARNTIRASSLRPGKHTETDQRAVNYLRLRELQQSTTPRPSR